MQNIIENISAENLFGFESTCVNTETLVEMNMPKQSNDPINTIVPQEFLEKMIQERVAQQLTQEQNDPRQYFDGNTFVPMLLAQEILRGLSVITLSDTKEIYVYENGVYKEGGEYRIRQIAQEKLKDKATTYRLNEVVNYIKNERNVIIKREDLNKETRIINLKNGLYDLNTGEFRPHTPEFLSAIQIPVNYNPSATCPKIEKFLSEVVSENDGKVLLEFAGYSLIPENKMKKSPILLGPGNNGKTVYLELQRKFIGDENTSSESLQDLTNNKYSSANLYGKLLNISSDIGDSKLLQPNILKGIIGGDKIRGEKKFQTSFDFVNTARLIFGANKLPQPKDESDKAFFKRWIPITFPNIFEGKNADENLLEKLTTDEEFSGFLNKALEALKELLIRGEYSDNKTVEELKRIYMINSDSATAFLDECIEEGTSGKVSKEAMYEAYVKWCPASVNPISKKSFDGKLKKNGINSYRDTVPDDKGMRKYTWLNVSIVE
jgi:putative DNA primase/helicase